MNNIIKNRTFWLILFLLTVSFIRHILINDGAFRGELPITNVIIEFVVFLAVILLGSSLYGVIGGSITGAIDYLILLFSSASNMSNLDTLTMLGFMGVVGVLTNLSIGRYLKLRNTLDAQKEQIQRQALDEIKRLHGLIPICSSCKRIRDDAGFWQAVEQYISKDPSANFTHSLCPICLKRLYPDIYGS